MIYQLMKYMDTSCNFSAERDCGAVSINTCGNVMNKFRKRDLSVLSREKGWPRLKNVIVW